MTLENVVTFTVSFLAGLVVLFFFGFLGGCASPRNDGVGELYKGVACVQKGNCS